MCVDSLIELIDNRIDKALNQSAHVNSLIGQVIAASNDRYDVKLFTTGAVYNLPNYSGSDVSIGEQVYVYYSGGFLSNQTAYIGASLNKPALTTFIHGIAFLGSLSLTPKKIASVYFLNTAPTTINLVFNAVISSATVGAVTFTILVDDEEYEYEPAVTANDGYTHCSFTLPVELSEISSHNIDIKASGVGAVTQIKTYIFGVSITESDWVVTSENDYIYIVRDNEATLLIYIGSYTRIITPLTMDGAPVTKISNSCFMNTPVEAVMISNGVITID